MTLKANRTDYTGLFYARIGGGGNPSSLKGSIVMRCCKTKKTIGTYQHDGVRHFATGELKGGKEAHILELETESTSQIFNTRASRSDASPQSHSGGEKINEKKNNS